MIIVFDASVLISAVLKKDLVLVAAERFQPAQQVRDCPDPGDDRYLALAMECGATAIVSSDERHLLPMSPWRGIPILRPAEFVTAHQRLA